MHIGYSYAYHIADYDVYIIQDVKGSRKMKHLRTAINIVSFALLGVSLIWLLTVYGSFPEQMGIHYGEDNDFDVIASKIFAFYPFIAGFGLCGIISLLEPAVKKAKKAGKDLSGEKTEFIKKAALIVLSAMKLFWAVFFTIWNYCIIHRIKMFTFGIPIRRFQTFPIYFILSGILAYDSYFRLKKSKKYITAAVIITGALWLAVCKIKG